ncbi:hypothetical protein [Saliphagus infecundisoli]|uniref:Uncharacterized protein n=1 Tax=Saliphagus infecundisoli TaxID=1849069 RepID=A0ABD5QD93_9EURY|nr:hypothetical protein [Saliphagus infecundisoli]
MALFPLSQSELWTLRVLFFGPVLLGTGGMALSGTPIGASLLSGGTVGGFVVLPLLVGYLLVLSAVESRSAS